jgi:hypothetical protein
MKEEHKGVVSVFYARSLLEQFTRTAIGNIGFAQNRDIKARSKHPNKANIHLEKNWKMNERKISR